jgi:hypothetical protein
MGRERFSSSSLRIMMGMLDRGSRANPRTFISTHIGSSFPGTLAHERWHVVPHHIFHRLPAKAVGESLGDPDGNQFSGEIPASGIKVDNAVAAGPPGEVLGILPGDPVHQHLQDTPLEGATPLLHDFVRESQKLRKALGLYLLWHLVRVLCRRGPGTLGVTKGKHIIVLNRADKVEGLLKILLGFARKANDDVGGQGNP